MPLLLALKLVSGTPQHLAVLGWDVLVPRFITTQAGNEQDIAGRGTYWSGGSPRPTAFDIIACILAEIGRADRN